MLELTPEDMNLKRGTMRVRTAKYGQPWQAGLDVSCGEAPKGTGQFLTDVSLPGAGVTEVEKAAGVFNRFANAYKGAGEPAKPELTKDPYR